MLEAVLDAPEASRARVLDALGASETERREIEELLGLDRDSARLLSPPHEGAHRELLGAIEARRMIGQRLGRYRTEALIATGGMGDVYRGVGDDGSVAAVKVIRGGLMSDAARGRFDRERRLLSRLNHPNIARLLDAGEDEGRAYLALELVDGSPLKQYCDEHGLGVRERLGLVATVCEAVAHAHQNLIVHRDLKPGNVLVTADGTPKLLDFGISKLIDEATEEQSATVTRALTPRYASPEQLLGRPVTTASDVYSIGVILHETLTGRRPVAEPFERDALGRGFGLDLDLEVRAILEQSLAFDARERYPSAEALGADLRRYLAGERVAAYPATRAFRARKWAARHRVLVASVGVVLILIVGGGATGFIMASRLAMEKRETEAAKTDADRVNRFLTETLGIASREARRGDLSWQGMLDDASKRLDGAGFSPRVEGELRLTLGGSYFSMGRIDDSGEHFGLAVDFLTAGYGDEHLLVAEAKEALAQYLHEMGEFDRGLSELRDAQAIRTRMQGAHHLETGLNIESQGRTEMIRRRFDEGEQLMLQAKVIYEIGGHDGALSHVLDRLGMLSMFRGDDGGAIAYRQQALDVQERMYGESSQAVALARFRLGEAHAAAGNYEAAERLMEESLRVIESHEGFDGLSSARFHSQLADVLARSGKIVRAEEEHVGAIRMLEAGLPGLRHDCVYARENYARFLWSQDRFGESLGHMREVAASYRDMLGDEHLRTRIALEMVERLEGKVSGSG